MLEIVFNGIYILSSIVVTVGFFFSVYHRKRYTKCIPITLGFLAFIQVGWFFNQSDVMDSLYDVAFIYIAYILLTKLGTSVYTKCCPKSCEIFKGEYDGRV